eukprot:11142544-Alexandrium_andersonii.AAC.1
MPEGLLNSAGKETWCSPPLGKGGSNWKWSLTEHRARKDYQHLNRTHRHLRNWTLWSPQGGGVQC